MMRESHDMLPIEQPFTLPLDLSVLFQDASDLANQLAMKSPPAPISLDTDVCAPSLIPSVPTLPLKTKRKSSDSDPGSSCAAPETGNKRQERMRIASREYRRKKKLYVQTLEAQVKDLEDRLAAEKKAREAAEAAKLAITKELEETSKTASSRLSYKQKCEALSKMMDVWRDLTEQVAALVDGKQESEVDKDALRILIEKLSATAAELEELVLKVQLLQMDFTRLANYILLGKRLFQMATGTTPSALEEEEKSGVGGLGEEMMKEILSTPVWADKCPLEQERLSSVIKPAILELGNSLAKIKKEGAEIIEEIRDLMFNQLRMDPKEREGLKNVVAISSILERLKKNCVNYWSAWTATRKRIISCNSKLSDFERASFITGRSKFLSSLNIFNCIWLYINKEAVQETAFKPFFAPPLPLPLHGGWAASWG